MLSAKWTAVSFFALTALGAASFMFAGCTVTSGTVNDSEGGTTTTPTPDSGTDSAVVDAAAFCPGNTKQTATFLNAKCQAALDEGCCAELTACFNIVPTAGDGGVVSEDCNKYSQCIPSCKVKTDGTPETDPAKIEACQVDCDILSGSTTGAPSDVQKAYEAIVTCASNHPTANSVCQ